MVVFTVILGFEPKMLEVVLKMATCGTFLLYAYKNNMYSACPMCNGKTSRLLRLIKDLATAEKR